MAPEDTLFGLENDPGRAISRDTVRRAVSGQGCCILHARAAAAVRVGELPRYESTRARFSAFCMHPAHCCMAAVSCTHTL